MSNLISVTQAGPNIIAPIQEAMSATNQMGKFRKAGQILKANPIGAVLTDLIFPDPVSSGTLTDTMKRFGPDAVDRNPTSTYNPLQ